MHLSWIDLAIVLVYVGGTLVAGTVARGAIKGVADFLVAGRSLSTNMAGATIVSTGLGLVTVMYFAEEGFSGGFAPFLIGIMATATHLVVARTGFLVSRLRHLRVMTVPEFYELKYTRGVRLLGGLILALAGTLNMGLFPILGSRFVVGFTGLPGTYVEGVMIAMIVVVVIYTLMGGMVSVVLTDFAQFVLLSLGFLCGTYFILVHPDLGWDNIVAAVQQHGGFDPISSDAYGWVFVAYFMCVGLIGVLWQPEMSRSLSSATPRVARRIYWIAAATSMGRAIIPMFWGAAALCFIGDPSFDGRLAMPHMMGQILPVGIAGLLLAGMFAAFMSTHDSYLLAWSGVIVRDVVSPIKAMLRGRQPGDEDETRGGLTGAREIYWTRVTVVVLAAFLAVFGVLYRPPETSFKFMYITGTIYFAGAVGTVGLGLYWRRANTVGAYCALILGAIGPLYFLIMSQFAEHVPDCLRFLVESSNWPALLSLILGAVGMLAGALLTQKSCPPRSLDFSGME